MLPKARWPVVQCGRDITEQEIARIRETVDTFGRLSRTELAETICEHLQWRTASGSNKVHACLKLLEKMESRGLFRLPEKQRRSRRVLGGPAVTGRTRPGPEIIGSVCQVGAVNLRVVADREEARLWNEFVSRYHFLGYKQPYGCQLRYFIESVRGRLGCMLFSGAAKSIGIRDRWIGWSQAERLRNLGWVVNNTRFLIFPWVRVRYLASHVLGQAARRIERDWQQRWRYRPVLLETFVDPRSYEGTCYLAANWLYLGMTSGQGLVRQGKSYATSAKRILVRPLVEDFRSILCSGGQEVRP